MVSDFIDHILHYFTILLINIDTISVLNLKLLQYI